MEPNIPKGVRPWLGTFARTGLAVHDRPSRGGLWSRRKCGHRNTQEVGGATGGLPTSVMDVDAETLRT